LVFVCIRTEHSSNIQDTLVPVSIRIPWQLSSLASLEWSSFRNDKHGWDLQSFRGSLSIPSDFPGAIATVLVVYAARKTQRPYPWGVISRYRIGEFLEIADTLRNTDRGWWVTVSQIITMLWNWSCCLRTAISSALKLPIVETDWDDQSLQEWQQSDGKYVGA